VDAIARTSIEQYAATAGVDRLTRMVVARWIGGQDHNLKLVCADRWSADRSRAGRYLDRLIEAGYQLSDAERAVHNLCEQAEPDGDDEDEPDEDDLHHELDDEPAEGDCAADEEQPGDDAAAQA
jgi:ParB family transcriptional regulator, chromosome partitioning protein